MVTIKLSNKLYYSLITIAIILLISAGVYAIQTVAPGTTPNPGHTLATIAPPPGCTSGQLLRYVTIEGVPNWECINPPVPSSNYIRNIEYVASSVLDCNAGQAFNCPSNKEVLGGGCDASGTSVIDSYPLGNNAWYCATPGTCRVHVICADTN